MDRIHNGLVACGISPQISQERNPVGQVWSVHLREPNTGLYTNGKGTTRLASRVSAYAEFCERLGSGYFFAPLYLGQDWQSRTGRLHIFSKSEKFFGHPDEMLNPGLWKIYDPDGSIRKSTRKHPQGLSVLSDAQTGSGQAGTSAKVLCLPFTSLTDDQSAFFPLNLIWNLYASNGLSAGNTPLEARIQGLSEIMERHVKYRIIREGLCLPDVPESYFSAMTTQTIQAIRQAGFRITIKDASLGGIFPVIVVGLIHPDSGEALLSFGSHPDFGVALERTVTELFQGRNLEHSAEFSAPCADNDLTADPGNLENHFINSTGLVPLAFFGNKPNFTFSPWPKPENRQAEYQRLLDILVNEGKTGWIRERLCCGVHVCQILVPGFSEVYPIEEVWEANTSRFQPLRAFLTQTDKVDDSTLQLCLDLVETEFSGAAGGQVIADLAGIDLAGSVWEGLMTSEFGALVHMAIGNTEKLSEYLRYEMDWASVASRRRGFWRAMQFLLDPQQDMDLPEILFSDAALAAARHTLEGKWPASLFPPLGADFLSAPAHREMLKLYETYANLPEN